MTPADDPKEGSSTSTPPPTTEEIVVNQGLLGVEFDGGLLVFEVDGNPVDPPCWLPLGQVEEFLTRAGGESNASQVESAAPDGVRQVQPGGEVGLRDDGENEKYEGASGEGEREGEG